MTEMKNDTENNIASMKPMTADTFHAYLRDLADRHEIENKSLLVNGRKVAKASILNETRNYPHKGDLHPVNVKFVELTTREDAKPLDVSQLDEFLETFGDEIGDIQVIVDGHDLGNATIEDAGVVLHQLPSPLTGEDIENYLETIIARYPVKDNPVLIDGRIITKAQAANHRIMLTHDPKPTSRGMKTSVLLSFLRTVLGRTRNVDLKTQPVMIGHSMVVNATVADNHVVFQTLPHMLEVDLDPVT